MADKEATVYIVDVGKSMGEKHHGRAETDLDWAMKYVWDKIATTVASGRKTLYAAVVAVRTDGTSNEMDHDESYQNITVLQKLGQVFMSDIRNLSEKIKPSNTNDGDVISAIVIAIQMISAVCKKLKYRRKIVLVTNGRSPLDPDNLKEITSKIREDNIDLVLLGVDFDDAEYGYKEEGKPEEKADNESVLKSLTEGCGGAFGTLEQAIVEMGIPRVKTVRPIPSYKGQLTLGDPEHYETAMAIDVERYPRTSVTRPPAASVFVVRSDMAPARSTQSSAAVANGDGPPERNGDGLSSVRLARTYQVKDSDAPGGKRDVEQDTLAKGYEYGRTAVHISESDETVTKLETKAGFDIVGFVETRYYDHYMNMGKTNIVIAQRTNNKAIMGLSSFIHALYELESCAIARLVLKDGKSPVLVLLFPHFEPNLECLVDVELPFAEDVRTYKFPPLDRIVTVSGKVLTEHRNIPNEGLRNAMDNFVDHMDLSLFGTNEEGEPAEYMAMGDTYSPTLHRLNQAIRFRAVHPLDPIPPPYDIITKYLHPHDGLARSIVPYIEKLKGAADVKTVPPKTMSRKRYRGRQQEQPRSGLDVTTLLAVRTKKNNISPENAIPEFKQILANAEEISTIKEAISQFGNIVEDWIKHSLGESGYDRALEGIRIMREECVEMEEPDEFNTFLKDLKKKLMKEELGGNRRELWWKIRVQKLGLIDKNMSPVSSVDEEEAKAFLSAGYS